MRVLVTRPQPQADEWAAALCAQGIDAVALPLLAIEAPDNPEPVRQTWRSLDRIRLLMFVSPAAVAWFFRLRPPQARWPEHCLAACPGPGSAQALWAAGEPLGLRAEQLICPPNTAQQFDSESLWPLLSPMDWQDQAVRIVSGGEQGEVRGRTWLTEQWRARGAHVDSVLSYQRSPGQWTPPQQAQALAALQQPSAHLWLFSSSQAMAHLAETHLPLWPDLPAAPWSQMRAVVTHPKMALLAQRMGWGQVVQSRPTVADLVQALHQLDPHAGAH